MHIRDAQTETRRGGFHDPYSEKCGVLDRMKRKSYRTSCHGSVFNLVDTAVCFIRFLRVYQKQVIGDLKADALVMKNMHIFDSISDLHPDAYDLNPDTLRITVINASGNVILTAMRTLPRWRTMRTVRRSIWRWKTGKEAITRRSTTLDKNMFYYAIRLDNGRILRIAREGDNIFALTQNMMLTVVGVFVLLFFFCILMSNYFTKNLVARSRRWRRISRNPGRRLPTRSWSRL